MLFQNVCSGCGGKGPSPCRGCVARMRPVGELHPAEPLCGLWAAFSYTGSGRELLARLKYHNRRSCLRWLVSALVGVLPSGIEADVVTWAPTSPQRRRHRGFDQAELLARALARELGLPAKGLLVRSDSGGQTGRTRSQRCVAPVFVARRGVPPAVLVVDDVITTGATLRAAAIALSGAGAERVNAVVAGATPLPSHRQPPNVGTMGVDYMTSSQKGVALWT